MYWNLLLAFVFSSILASPPVMANQSPGASDKTPILGLSLSGGGIRAAAFGYGVMSELDHVPIRCFELDPEQLQTDDHAVSECKLRGSFLDNVDIVSSVSGGTLPAGYLFTHTKEDFQQNFRKDLEGLHVLPSLVSGEKLKWTKTLDPSSIFNSVPMVLAAALDLALSPIRGPLSLFDIRFPEVTPLASMYFLKSVFKSNQLAAIYDRALFGGNQIVLEDLDNAKPHVEKENRSLSGQRQLLINATDLASGKIFTFSEETFRCMGAKSDYANFPLALAAAASSALPGVFSPVLVSDYLDEYNPEGSNTRECPTIEWQKTRGARLVDGGISDNLGLISLIRQVFKAKHGAGEKDRKSFIVAVNAGITESSTMPFEIARNIDDSFDVLMNNKTDLTRVLFEERLSNFGISVVEFQLSDVLRRPDIVKRIAKNLNARRYPDQDAEDPVSDTLDAGFEYTQIEQRIFNDLNKVGLYPTREEIRTLIEAGRALVRDRLSELYGKYRELYKRRFYQNCSNVITPETSYCWPEIFEGADLLSTSTGILLKNYMIVTEAFLRPARKPGSSTSRISKRGVDLYTPEKKMTLCTWKRANSRATKV